MYLSYIHKYTRFIFNAFLNKMLIQNSLFRRWEIGEKAGVLPLFICTTGGRSVDFVYP